MKLKDLFGFGKEEPKKEEPPKPNNYSLEDTMFNPLKSHCGGFIELNTIEGSKTYQVTEIIQYDRILSGESYKFTDYKLEDFGKIKILRVFPKIDEKFITGEDDLDILLMEVFYEGEFEEEIQEALEFPEFYKNNDDGSKITYYAMGASNEGINANLSISEPGSNYFKSRTIKYWGFYRDPDIKLGEISTNKIILYVEIDQDNGYITMYQGTNIPDKEVKIYNK